MIDITVASVNSFGEVDDGSIDVVEKRLSTSEVIEGEIAQPSIRNVQFGLQVEKVLSNESVKRKDERVRRSGEEKEIYLSTFVGSVSLLRETIKSVLVEMIPSRVRSGMRTLLNFGVDCLSAIDVSVELTFSAVVGFLRSMDMTNVANEPAMSIRLLNDAKSMGMDRQKRVHGWSGCRSIRLVASKAKARPVKSLLLTRSPAAIATAKGRGEKNLATKGLAGGNHGDCINEFGVSGHLKISTGMAD